MYVKQAVEHKNGILDLSGLLMINENHMTQFAAWTREAPVILHPGIKTIVMCQNVNINSYEWIKSFPNAKILSIWYSNTLSERVIKEIVSYLPKLESLEFHSCFNITGRCLIHISKLKLLNKLIIDYPRISCSQNIFSTIISPKDWEQIDNSSLELLMINTDNLTMNFVHYITKSFKNLSRFMMSQAVLQNVHTNMYSGFEKESIIFQSFENPKKWIPVE